MTSPGPHPNGSDHDSPLAGPSVTGDPSLSERLVAVGLGELEGQGISRPRDEGPLGRLTGLGADLGQRLTTLGARVDTLANGLSAQEDRLRDAERSLVDRIADVDDDRRRTQSQLQRAQQSQFDELQGGLGRLGGLTMAGLLAIAILTAGGLYLIHHLQAQRLGEIQRDLLAETRGLGLELERLKGAGALGTQPPVGVQERIEALSSTVDQLATDLAQTKSAPPAEIHSQAAEVGLLTEQITRLESHQRDLVDEIDALQQALKATTAGSPEVPVAPELVPSHQTQEVEVAAAVTTPEVEAQAAAAPSTEPDPLVAGGEAATARVEAPSSPPPGAPDPGRPFALQLMGSYDRRDLLQLAARSDLPEPVYIREETLRGRPWFVLIHSLHPSYAEAQAERDRLPGRLAKLDTWIRNLPPAATLEPIPTGRGP